MHLRMDNRLFEAELGSQEQALSSGAATLIRLDRRRASCFGLPGTVLQAKFKV
jgi:hypothetical protein